jgi:hypothetical protein
MSHFGTKIPNQLIESDWANELEDAITGDGTLVSLASYLVYKSGTTYYAKPLTAGGTAITPNADATTVIQATVNALTSGGTIFLKELELPGAVTYGNSIIIIEDYQGRRKIYSNQGKALNIPLLAADPSTVGWGNAEKGYTWFNTTSGYYKYWNGAAVVSYPVVGGAGAPVTSSYVTINDETADLAASVQHANIVDPVYAHGPLDASYVVFKSGATYYARGCGTGFSNYSGADAATVIQAAMDGLTAGRTWKEKVVIKGDVSLATYISPPSYTELDIYGRLTTTANVSLIRCVGTVGTHLTDICVKGGLITGNATGSGQRGFLVDYCDNSDFRDITVKSMGQNGFYIRNSQNNEFSNCWAEDNDFNDWYITYGAKSNRFVGCTGKRTTASSYSRFRLAIDQTGATDHCENNLFIGCKAFGLDGTDTDNGWYLCSRDSVYFVQRNTFIGCKAFDFTATGQAGFKCNPAQANTFVDCEAVNCNYGFYFGTFVSSTDLENCVKNSVKGGQVIVPAGGGSGVRIKGEDDAPVGYADQNKVSGLTVIGTGGTSYGVYIWTTAAANTANDNIVENCHFISLTTPIYIADARCNRTLVHGNDWYGCTNDPTNSGTNTRIKDNIDKDGAWEAEA